MTAALRLQDHLARARRLRGHRYTRALAQPEGLLLPLVFDHGRFAAGGKELHAFGRRLTDAQDAGLAAVHDEHRLAVEEGIHRDIGGVHCRGAQRVCEQRYTKKPHVLFFPL